MVSEPISVFISYARQDEVLMRELESHLSPLKRNQLISSWHDGCIGPGEEWDSQIKINLAKAQIILLLISVDFIKSDYCYEVELTKAIERHQAGNAYVIPVILRSCLWQPTPVGKMQLGELQALPKNAEPLSKWSDRDEAFTNIVAGLLEAIQQLRLGQGYAEYALHQAAHYSYQDTKRFLIEATYRKQATEDRLDSQRGIDYTHLRDLLKAGKWKMADSETENRMLEAVGRSEDDWIHKEELLSFPCNDLTTIDQLWVKYSQGKWGFSVQNQIYVECGAHLDGGYPGTNWDKFCDRVGWRKNEENLLYSQLTFDLKKSPLGELPLLGVGLEKELVVMGIRSWAAFGFFVHAALFSRIESCEL